MDSALDPPVVRLTQVQVLPSRVTLGKFPGCTCSLCIRALGLYVSDRIEVNKW